MRSLPNENHMTFQGITYDDTDHSDHEPGLAVKTATHCTLLFRFPLKVSPKNAGLIVPNFPLTVAKAGMVRSTKVRKRS